MLQRERERPRRRHSGTRTGTGTGRRSRSATGRTPGARRPTTDDVAWARWWHVRLRRWRPGGVVRCRRVRVLQRPTAATGPGPGARSVMTRRYQRVGVAMRVAVVVGARRTAGILQST